MTEKKDAIQDKQDSGTPGPGQPTKYDAKYHPKIVKYMTRTGMTDKEISKDLEISESTLNLWKLKHPEFSESLKENKNFIDSLVEDSLLKRALGFDYVETTIIEKKGKTVETRTTNKKVIGSEKAQQYWLNNRQSKYWKNMKWHSFNEEAPLKIKNESDLKNIPDDELRKMIKDRENEK